MKKYEKPMMEVTKFNKEDFIICGPSTETDIDVFGQNGYIDGAVSDK